jgi:hypothetical protein
VPAREHVGERVALADVQLAFGGAVLAHRLDTVSVVALVMMPFAAMNSGFCPARSRRARSGESGVIPAMASEASASAPATRTSRRACASTKAAATSGAVRKRPLMKSPPTRVT